MHSAKNTIIPPNFLVWKFCEKAQFPQMWNYGILHHLIIQNNKFCLNKYLCIETQV